MTWKKYGWCLLASALLMNCKKDDGIEVTIIPPRDLAEVAAEDQATIQEFLNTHFYNYDEFASPPADFDYKIRIDTIAGANADKTPLSADIQSMQITVSPDQLNLDQTGDVVHTLYYLEADTPGGDSRETPTIADSVLVTYKGSLLSGLDFDGTFSQPVWFDLARIQGPGGGARGFTEALAHFKVATGVVANPDGTLMAENPGSGLMIMPSGLAFFGSASGSIPAYSPLIFTVELFGLKRTDHDGDGVPSIDEDVNGDGYLFNDNTDQSDEEKQFGGLLTVNYLDTDDDGDGTRTRDEIVITDGVVSYPDADGDGTPDYLDPDTK